MVEEDVEFTTFDGVTISKSEYRDELIMDYVEAETTGLTKITDFTVGSEAYFLVDLLAKLRLEFREELDNCYQMSMVHSMVGEFLDNYGDVVGVHRRGSSPSVGEVTFTRKSGVTGDISIPTDVVVATDDAISFSLTDEYEEEEWITLPSNQNTVTVEVMCEQEGEYTNVEAGTIVLVMDSVGNQVTVSNSSAFTEGEDIEEDTEYLARILESSTSEPVGSLAWYTKEAESLDSVHDVTTAKGTLSTDPDVVITFNPVDWTATVTNSDYDSYNETNSIESVANHVLTVARKDLVDHFNLNEYNMAGISVGYHLVTRTSVLKPTTGSDEEYEFAILVKTGYVLADLKDSIYNVIVQFNKDAESGIEFNPNNLAVLIEEVEGVSICRIVKRTGTSTYSYTEVTSTTSIDTDKVYQVYYTNETDLKSRIKELSFDLDVTVSDD